MKFLRFRPIFASFGWIGLSLFSVQSGLAQMGFIQLVAPGEHVSIPVAEKASSDLASLGDLQKSKGDQDSENKRSDSVFDRRVQSIIARNWHGSQAWKDVFGQIPVNNFSSRWLKAVESIKNLDDFEAAVNWSFPRIQKLGILSRIGGSNRRCMDQVLQLSSIWYELALHLNSIQSDRFFKRGTGSNLSGDPLTEFYNFLLDDAEKAITSSEIEEELGVLNNHNHQHFEACRSVVNGSGFDSDFIATLCDELLWRASRRRISWEKDPLDLLLHSVKHPIRLKQRGKSECWGNPGAESFLHWVAHCGPRAYEQEARSVLLQFSGSGTLLESGVHSSPLFIEFQQAKNPGISNVLGTFRLRKKLDTQDSKLRCLELMVDVQSGQGGLDFFLTTYQPRLPFCQNSPKAQGGHLSQAVLAPSTPSWLKNIQLTHFKAVYPRSDYPIQSCLSRLFLELEIADLVSDLPNASYVH